MHSARVNIAFVRNVRSVQGLVVRRPRGCQSRVELPVMHHDRFSLPGCDNIRAGPKKKAKKKASKKIVIRVAVVTLEKVPIPKPDKDSRK